MNILFLDVDGVLNSVDFMKTRYVRGDKKIDRAAVARLNALTERTGAQVVISSWWRARYSQTELTEILRAFGMQARIIGLTPIQGYGKRGELWHRGLEIQAWLDGADPHRRRFERFVILDDDADMLHLLPYLVQTDAEVGLTDADVERAVALLLGED